MSKIKNMAFAAVAILILPLLLGIQTSAADRVNSITVDFSVENHTVGISGGEFALLKVLDFKDGFYTIDKSIEGCDITIDDVLNNPDETADKIAENQLEYLDKKITDQSGKITFSQLEDGVYLVHQIGRTGAAEEFFMAKPSLIQVPQWQGDSLIGDVLMYPKTIKQAEPEEPGEEEEPEEPEDEEPEKPKEEEPEEPKDEEPKKPKEEEPEKPKEEEPEKPKEETPKTPGNTNKKTTQVKTGDDTNVLFYISMAILSFSVVLSMLSWRKENNE